MTETFERIVRLVKEGNVVVSDHGYDELAAEGVFAREVLNTVTQGVVVEEYPDYWKGPCVLVLQRD